MRINKISVTKLFGIFNHPVSFNMEDRITIIHGPNGFGKTALLRIINGFFNSRYSELRSIPFAEFRVDFDDGSHLLITKSLEKTSEKEKDKELTFHFYKPGLKTKTFSSSLVVDLKPNGLSIIENTVPGLERIGHTTWLYLAKEQLSLEDVWQRFGNFLPESLVTANKEPKWLSETKSSLDVRFIEAQRLLSLSNVSQVRVDRKRPSMIPSVDTYSQELAEDIQTKQAEYGTLSQSLDRTFPARVVNNKMHSDLTEETLRNKLNEIEEKRYRLRETGLLEADENSDFQVQEKIDVATQNILSVYLEDVEKKITIFNELATKIELFKRIIQQRFLYKNMSISKEKGFTFTTPDGKPLSPNDLSSGEQHELVMLYELLFKVKPNSLILIDEPELSLHIAWQVDFLKDLQAIIKLANFDVLIATHSPSIIEDRWDLTVELKGPVA